MNAIAKGNRRRPPSGLIAAALGIVLALAVLAACGGDGRQSFRGVVTDVSGSDLVQWDTVTLQDQFGTSRTFLRGDSVDLRDWRASHLRQHMAEFAAVTVFYRTTERGLVAVEIKD